MRNLTISCILLASVVLAAAPAAAKEKKQRALVALPIIVEAPAHAAPRTFSFRAARSSRTPTR